MLRDASNNIDAWASSGTGMNEWLIVDLGQDTAIGDITLWYTQNHAKLFAIDALPASAGDPLVTSNWVDGVYTTFYSVTPETYLARG